MCVVTTGRVWLCADWDKAEWARGALEVIGEAFLPYMAVDDVPRKLWIGRNVADSICRAWQWCA